MQVTETLSQGLKREFTVVLPASDLAARLTVQLDDLKTMVKINGFRPGKVPVAHLKRVYGRSVMADVVQEAVNEANRKIVEDNQLRLAQEPRVEFPANQAEVELALETKGDLAYKVALELLPKFDVGSFDGVTLERLVTDVADDEVTKTVDRMADRTRTYDERAAGEKSVKGDKVTMSFVGTIDGVAFEGGTSENIDLIIGSDSFIPGFEPQVEGIAAGEERVVKVSFPENYAAAHLAGKAAQFAVKAKAVAKPGDVKVDDEFSKGFGFDTVDKLKDAIRENIGGEYKKMSRDKMKRSLLDQLDKLYSFDLPQGLVDTEYATIWSQVEREQQQSKRSFEDEGTTEEAAKADYRRIAERRVRLGLLLAEVGEKAKVQVSDDEVTQALVERARGFPGQEKVVWEFYQKNPERLAEIRAPIFEEKVVDHIVALANVTEKKVTREELMKFDDADEAAKPKAKAKAKKKAE